jgi:hypothetical protein
LALLLAATALPALADPPARVGRVSYVSGEAFFRTDNDAEWSQATLNYPVTSRNEFTTNADARLELQVGSASIRLDEDSEISIPRLDDDVISIYLRRGLAGVTVRSRESRYPVEIVTDDATVTLNGTGTYRIQAGRDAPNSIVTVLRGSASVSSDAGTFTVREGNEAVITSEPSGYTMREASPDPFDDWAMARDERYERGRSAAYVSPDVTGYEDLDEYGDWQETPQYGAVWVPRVAEADWAPYRYGHWVSVAPWGWTWVDYAPWGFAPFHYGRWVYFSGHWGWAPGPVRARAVYAPALVAWVGQPGWSFSFSVGTGPAVGWFPLGWGEIYRPYYPCSTSYVRNVNITNVHITNINNVNWTAPDPNKGNYALRRFPQAVTVVPQNAFASGKPVMRVREPLRDVAPVAKMPAMTNAAPRVAPVRIAAPANAPQPTAPAARQAAPRRLERMPEGTPAQARPGAPARQAAPAAPPGATAAPRRQVAPPAPSPSGKPDEQGRRTGRVPEGRSVTQPPATTTQPAPAGTQPRATYANPRRDAIDSGAAQRSRAAGPGDETRRQPTGEPSPRPTVRPAPQPQSAVPSTAVPPQPAVHAAPPRTVAPSPPPQAAHPAPEQRVAPPRTVAPSPPPQAAHPAPEQRAAPPRTVAPSSPPQAARPAPEQRVAPVERAQERRAPEGRDEGRQRGEGGGGRAEQQR